MASSSVSQDDVEVNFEISSRRSKIRTARARNINPSSSRQGEEDCESTECRGLSTLYPGALDGGLDHDVSPKPSNRMKEKRVSRAGNVNKGKQQRDRRKLREKRRSTGVVHLPSTEVMTSTGGSTGEDDELLSLTNETRRNTLHLDQSAGPNTSQVQDYKHRKPFSKPRTKSPSDFEADDEDNQDYDSLTMSDSTLSLAQPSGVVIGGTNSKTPPTWGGAYYHHSSSHHHHHRALPHTISKFDLVKQCNAGGTSPHPALMRGTTYCSGMCSRGGSIIPRTSDRANGRPATPSSESSEELLERAREENRRLLVLLAEREQRISILEGRLLSSKPPASTEGVTSSGGLDPVTQGIQSLSTN